MENQRIKTCTKCKDAKPEGDFYKQKKSPDGFHAHCKSCRSEYDRRLRETAEDRRPLVESKKCKHCGEIKPSRMFACNATCVDRLYPYCRACQRLRDKERWKKSAKEASRLRQFGLTPGAYDRMYEDQCGLCWICQQEETCSDGRSLAVDHCHATGKVRGLLCSKCNRAIGSFGDDPDVIARAAEYLRRN
jgi:hypothetical protein